MTKYEKAKCKCGWYCLVLKETQSVVYHCGQQVLALGDSSLFRPESLNKRTAAEREQRP